MQLDHSNQNRNKPINSTYPLCVLMCPDQQMYNPWQCSVLPQWGVVGRAQGQIPDEADDGLDEGPAARWVEKFDQYWQAVVKSHCILGHLGLGVSACQMSQSTYLEYAGFHSEYLYELYLATSFSNASYIILS